MRKNIKNSIWSILTIVIVLSVAVVFLTAAKPANQIELEELSESINIETEIQKESIVEEGSIEVKEEIVSNNQPSLLGMGMFSTDQSSVFEGQVNTLMSVGFNELRIDIPSYQNTGWMTRSKEAVRIAISKGAKVVWGISSYNKGGHADYTIIAENWPAFRQAALENAQWAQDNGVYEFQLGNEEEFHIWRNPVSITRNGNIATATFSEDHGFSGAHPVIIWGAEPSDFNAYTSSPTQIAVTGPKTFNYQSEGPDGSVSNPNRVHISSMSEDQLILNLRALATEVQSIFTRGNISYTTSCSYFLDKWNTVGRGDIDIIAANVYQNQSDWQEVISNIVSWWGPAHTYITEFNINYTSLDNYSTNENEQSSELNSMIDYIKASGISRAYYFCYQNDKFGALKGNGTPRALWEEAIIG